MDKLPSILKRLVEAPIVEHIDIILDSYERLTNQEIKLLLVFYQTTLYKLTARNRVRDYELIYLFNEFNGQVEKSITERKKDKN